MRSWRSWDGAGLASVRSRFNFGILLDTTAMHVNHQDISSAGARDLRDMVHGVGTSSSAGCHRRPLESPLSWMHQSFLSPRAGCPKRVLSYPNAVCTRTLLASPGSRRLGLLRRTVDIFFPSTFLVCSVALRTAHPTTETNSVQSTRTLPLSVCITASPYLHIDVLCYIFVSSH